jgi:hypothetical protein
VGPWDGSAEAEPLTKPNDDPINNTQPAWSPDGERIVFRTDRSDPSRNVADIWVMDSPAVAPAQRASARQPWHPCKKGSRRRLDEQRHRPYLAPRRHARADRGLRPATLPTSTAPSATPNHQLTRTSVLAGSPYVQRVPGGQSDTPSAGTKRSLMHTPSARSPVCRNRNAPASSSVQRQAMRGTRGGIAALYRSSANGDTEAHAEHRCSSKLPRSSTQAAGSPTARQSARRTPNSHSACSNASSSSSCHVSLTQPPAASSWKT